MRKPLLDFNLSLHNFKATVSFRWDWLGLPCLVQLLTWLHVSDYHNFGTLKKIVSKLIVRHQIIVSFTETSSKMASTFCQKWLTIFLSKRSKCYIVRTIRCCSSFTSMWSKYLSNLTINASISNGIIKYPIGKSIFGVNLPLKPFPATVNADIRSLKSLHTFLKEYL